MRMVDTHIDIADMYKYFQYSLDDFFVPGSAAPISLEKLFQAGIEIVGATLYVDECFTKSTSVYDGAMEYLSFYKRMMSQTDRLQLIRSSVDLVSKPPGTIGFIITLEGFECCRTRDDFDLFYDHGARIFGFTWNNDNQYACGRDTTNEQGMTAEGLSVIRMMNERKKLIVDIAHLSEQSVRDLDQNFNGMIVATHANSRSIFDSVRNLTDDEIQIVVDRGGVIGLFPLVEFTGPHGTFDDLYRHFEYIASKWGLEYVGFTSDLYPIPEIPFLHGYDDILIMKHLSDYLSKKLPQDEVEMVLHGNWFRVLEGSL